MRTLLKKPLSRARRWQIKQQELCCCPNCGDPLDIPTNKSRCSKCLEKQVVRQRIANGIPVNWPKGKHFNARPSKQD